MQVGSFPYFPVGCRVKSTFTDSLCGAIASAPVMVHRNGFALPAYIVDLDSDGFWSREKNLYINFVCVSAELLRPESTEDEAARQGAAESEETS